MEIQIENLKAKMRGVELNSYQKGLALDEFKKPLNAYNVQTAWRGAEYLAETLKQLQTFKI